MFSSFATAEYTVSSICVPLIMFTVCCIALFIGFRLCRGMKIGGRLSPFITAGFEAGMLGYTLFAILFGEEMRPSFAIVDLGQVLFGLTVYKVLLAGKNNVGDALKEAIKEKIQQKDGNLVGQMVSEGTTPRRLTDLIGSLCDLTSGSGDKGTPIVFIQGYFDNYTTE